MNKKVMVTKVVDFKFHWNHFSVVAMFTPSCNDQQEKHVEH